MPGQWVGSTRASRLPADWHARRAACYRQARGLCQDTTNGQRCNTYAPLHKTATQAGGHADHADRTAGDDQTNLQWLCPPHHRAKTSAEGTAALPRERRPTPPHPGLA